MLENKRDYLESTDLMWKTSNKTSSSVSAPGYQDSDCSVSTQLILTHSHKRIASLKLCMGVNCELNSSAWEYVPLSRRHATDGLIVNSTQSTVSREKPWEAMGSPSRPKRPGFNGTVGCVQRETRTRAYLPTIPANSGPLYWTGSDADGGDVSMCRCVVSYPGCCCAHWSLHSLP